jgi:hypothetical protein
MTEDLAGGAPAPADTPAIVETTNTPEPAPANEPTPRNAIDRAFEAVEKANPAAKVEKAAEAAPVADTGERERNPDGTFKAKETAAQPAPEAQQPEAAAAEQKAKPGPHSEAPARFASDPEAKAAWDKVPDAVKAATHRMVRELEQGIETYRGDAKAYQDTFKPFVEMARRSGVDEAKTLANYVNIDMLLAKDFNAGIAQIFKNKGQDLKAWAAQIATGEQAPQPSQQDQIIADLRRELADLKQGFTGVRARVEQQSSAEIGRSLEGFVAALPEADRALFDELDQEIAAHLQADRSLTLTAAFAKAKSDAQARYARMFGTAPASDANPVASAAAQTRVPDPAPQTRNGQLQVSGAPGSGSNPASRKAPSSTREALDRAFADIGL